MHTTLTVARFAHAVPAPTRLACDGAAALGLTLDDLPSHDTTPLRLDLTPASLTVLTGASGSGKSTLRTDIHRAFADAHSPMPVSIVDPATLRPGSRSCLELLGGKQNSVGRALDRLARCGLADASAITARASTLSDGQRERLMLALAMQRAERLGRRMPVLLSIDELGARVDDAAARAMARCLRRWVESQKDLDIRVLVTTHRSAALDQLRPATLVRLSPLGEALSTRDDRAAPAFDELYRIESGSRADLRALAPLHYRPGAPATIARVLRCTDRSTGELVGVLSVSLPTLNGRWREPAWPGRYQSDDRRADAHRLCSEVRCISRVIVSPSHRSMGVARELIRAYLADPLTVRTEAVSAMGRISPVFERAGMVAHDLAPASRHRRLLSAFDHAGIASWRLAQPSVLEARLHTLPLADHQFIRTELSLWAGASRATRRFTDAPLKDQLAIACRAISASPVAYTHDASCPSPLEGEGGREADG